MPKTMRLLTLHGRNRPYEDMNDWGFEGPTIENIVAVHNTYGEQNIYFASESDAQTASRQTGWREFGERALSMQMFEDMLVLTEADGRTRYYGDWEFQTQTGSGEPVPDPVESDSVGDESVRDCGGIDKNVGEPAVSTAFQTASIDLNVSVGIATVVCRVRNKDDVPQAKIELTMRERPER